MARLGPLLGGRPGALRELALLWVADRVEESLHGYLEAHGIEGTWETRERVVVGITGRPGGEALIRRASRMAGRGCGDLVGVHVAIDDGLARPSTDTLASQRKLVSELGGPTHDIVGHDAAVALVAFARREKATQLVLGASRRTRLQEMFRGSFVGRVIRLAGDIDVHVIHDEGDDEVERPGRHRRRSPLQTFEPRRVALGWVLTLAGLPALIALVLPLREETAISMVLLLVLLSSW